MAIGRLYLSHCNYDFAALGIEKLTKKNLKKILQSNIIRDYCTSVEDCGLSLIDIDNDLLSKCQFIECLDISWEKVIHLENHDYWAHVAHLLLTKYKNTSKGLDDFEQSMLFYSDFHRSTKKTSKKTLWVAGCSWSSAFGVEDTERWGNLVANKLDYEEVNLAIGGGSLWDASDQIIRADIKEEDLIIWGLTSAGRIDVIKNNNLKSFPAFEAQVSKYYKKTFLFSTSQYLIAMRQIQQVITHCNKIKAKLYLVNFLEPCWIPLLLKDHNNFLDLSSGFYQSNFKLIDYAADNAHPGPKQHQEYAEKIINFIKETNNVR